MSQRARWGVAARIALLVALAPVLMAVERPKGLGDVGDVRTWSYPDYTRVVVELTHAVEPEVFRLGADATAGLPERLYLDLSGIWVGKRYLDGILVGDGLLQAVRLGQNTLSRSRLVIDLESYASHRMMVLRSPHRVVVDIYGPPAGSPGPRPLEPRLPPELRPLRTVIVDPGHGGRDPGAIGVGQLREKDVNLRLARLLRPRLEARGFEVVMTRDADVALDLEDRTAIAESASGDLFLSIHANASRRRATRGIEVYYLDENHDRHTMRVAEHENGVSRRDLDALQLSLASLRVSETSVSSSRLARTVHRDLMGGLSRRFRGVRDLGVKQGPFYVLYLSSIPSILVEAGFLTNRDDAKLLRNEKYLASVADQLALGVAHYRSRGEQFAGAPR